MFSKSKSMKRFLLQLAILLTVGSAAIAQTHTVTGKVVGDHGQPLSGAEIMVAETEAATTSDENGDWMVEVPDGKTIFFAQAAGYNPKTIQDTGEFIMIQLLLASQEQIGVINTALGISKDRREVGYNAVTIGNETLTEGGNSSAISGMAGKIDGADIASTGSFGGTTNINLRGLRSFLQSSSPLIVVDGVVTNNFQRTASNQGIANVYNQVDFGNGANDINPDDIETITILEGPTAAIMYGSAGANGAVIITTKSAKEGTIKKMEVTCKTDVSQVAVLDLPTVQHNFGQGDIYNGSTDYRATNYSWGLPFDNALRPWGQIIDGKQMVKPYNDQPNNIKYFFNNSSVLNNYASIKGGDEKSAYFLSLNAVNSYQPVPNDFYNRYNMRFNGSRNLGNNFYAVLNVNYMHSQSRSNFEGDGGPTGNGGIMENLINTPRDIPTWELNNLKSNYFNMNYINTSGNHVYGNYSSSYMNPYWVGQYFDNENTSNRITGDVKLGYKAGFIDVFNRIGVDYNADVSTYQTPWYKVSASELEGIYPGTSYQGTGFNSNGGYAQANYNGARFYDDLIGTYCNMLNPNWGMNITAGTNLSMMRDAVLNSQINPVTNGLIVPEFYNFSNAMSAISSANYVTEMRTFGLFADFRFNYRRNFYIEFTGRTDWSSTYNYDDPHFFPGMNMSWIFTEKLNGKIKDKILNYGKLRFGAAGAGNNAIPYANNAAGFAQLPIASANGAITTPFNTIPVYQIQNIFGDQNLRPELTREFETGFDLSFLKDRLMCSFTYYNSYSSNLIAAVKVAPSTGYQYEYENIGDVTNKGEELTIKGSPIKTKWGLRWDLFASYYRNVNDVVNLVNGQQNIVLGSANGIEIVAAEGHPLGTFYGNNIAYYQNPKDGSWHPIVDATTGLPVPTKNPVLMGSYLPKFQASWGTDLIWNGLKLHVLFTTKQGGVYFSQIKEQMDANGTAQETTVNNRAATLFTNNAVNQVGTTNTYLTNTTKYLPYNYFVNEIGQNKLPGQNLVNASYIRLQELSLSYRVPQKYYARSPFGALEAGLYGNNLLIWTAKSNQYGDPDVAMAQFTGNNTGINYSYNPALKQYGFFIKVTF